MDDEIRQRLIEWIKRQQRACDAQIEAVELVGKISEALTIGDMVKKIQECQSGSQHELN
jgi:hypothetical protein